MPYDLRQEFGLEEVYYNVRDLLKYLNILYVFVLNEGSKVSKILVLK